MKAMHPLFRKWLTIFLVVLLIGVLGGGMAVGALIGYLENLPPITSLENYSPPEIARVYDRTGNRQIGEFSTERREVVRINEIPLHVQQAFLAIEDERFYKHFGIDIRGIGRAIAENLKSGGRAQGASTITMQVARNIVLEDRSKNFARKIKEVFLAMQIERDFSKDQILEFYLNEIFFGSRAYGIQEASRVYFNKDVKDLNIQEAAMLAGLPKAPSSLSPFNNKMAALNRRNLVLFNMRRNGFIKDESEYKRLSSLPIELNPPVRPKTVAPYFVSYVSNLLVKENNLQTQQDLGQKAYQVISTVDLELQTILEEEMSKALRKVELESEGQKEERLGKEERNAVAGQRRLARISEVGDEYIRVSVGGRSARVPLPEKLPYFHPEKVIKRGGLVDVYIASLNGGPNNSMEAYLYDKAHVQGGAVLLDNKTGEILAMVGGDDFNDSANNGEYNRAFQGGSQPGSVWKPLLFAGALDVEENGKARWTPGSVIMDEPFSIGSWTPKNYENRYYGANSLYQALVHSRNVSTVKLFTALGSERSIKIYNNFNLLSRPSDWDIPRVAPVSLGTEDVTPLELAAAFAVFPNNGVGYKPTPIKRLFSSKNSSDTRFVKPEEYQVLSPEAGYMMSRILTDAVMRGTAKSTVGKWVEEQRGKGRKIPDVAGKTGTTNDSYNALFAGFTPDLTLVINVGYDQPRSLGPRMTGGRVVGPIWVAMMDRILETRTDWQQKFTVPAGVTFRDMCATSGRLVASGCTNVYKDVAFKTGTEPTTTCGHHGGGRSVATSSSDSPADPEAQYDTGQQYPPQYNTHQYNAPQYYRPMQPNYGYR